MSQNGPNSSIVQAQRNKSIAFPFDNIAIIWRHILKWLPLRGRGSTNAVARIHPNINRTLNDEIIFTGDFFDERISPADKVFLALQTEVAAMRLFSNPNVMGQISTHALLSIAAKYPPMRAYLIKNCHKLRLSQQEAFILTGDAFLSYSVVSEDPIARLMQPGRPARNQGIQFSEALWDFLLSPFDPDKTDEQVQQANAFRSELQTPYLRVTCAMLHEAFAIAFYSDIIDSLRTHRFYTESYKNHFRFESIAKKVVCQIELDGLGQNLAMGQNYPIRLDSILKCCFVQHPRIAAYISQSAVLKRFCAARLTAVLNPEPPIPSSFIDKWIVAPISSGFTQMKRMFVDKNRYQMIDPTTNTALSFPWYPHTFPYIPYDNSDPLFHSNQSKFSLRGEGFVEAKKDLDILVTNPQGDLRLRRWGMDDVFGPRNIDILIFLQTYTELENQILASLPHLQPRSKLLIDLIPHMLEHLNRAKRKLCIEVAATSATTPEQSNPDPSESLHDETDKPIQGLTTQFDSLRLNATSASSSSASSSVDDDEDDPDTHSRSVLTIFS